MKPAAFREGQRVLATDSDGTVYEGVVRYTYTTNGGRRAYAVEVEGKEDSGPFHFAESALRPANPVQFREFT
jgi:hypothetical protein